MFCGSSEGVRSAYARAAEALKDAADLTSRLRATLHTGLDAMAQDGRLSLMLEETVAAAVRRNREMGA